MNICRTCVKTKVKQWTISNRKRSNEGCRRRNHSNPEARKATQSRYVEKNRERIYEKTRMYFEKNKEHVREIKRKSAEKHRDNILKYRADHREEINAKSSQYQKDHPEKAKERKARRRARKAGALIADFTAEQWVELQESYDHRCAYCNKRCKGKLTQDHVTPIINGGSHTLSNIVPACMPCNRKKHTGPPLRPVQPLLLTISIPKENKQWIKSNN
jgi:5-methylcytosine-specific restriction endonuclease McrA